MKIGVFGNKYQENRSDQIIRVFNQLLHLRAEVWVEEDFFRHLKSHLMFEPQIQGLIKGNEFDIEIALSLGGDGTFLRTAALIGKRNIPIVGVNAGSLGFLADIADDAIELALEEIVAGNFRIEERALLKLKTEENVFHGFNYALNEIAVLKRDTSSMILVHAYLNDEYLASYRADGLIVATPTGSTAYSMSVNGPIIVPTAQSLVLSPIAPHSLTVRPLVIPDDYKITLDVESRSGHFRVAIDGHSEVFPTGTRLTVCKADHTIKVIKREQQSFYETMRNKLMWGSDNRN